MFKSLRDFIYALKRNNYGQAYGRLFMLSEDGDLYACALGQGLLATDMSEEHVRQTLKPEGLATYGIIKDGKVLNVKGRASGILESEGNRLIDKAIKEGRLPRGIGEAMTLNDAHMMPIPEIGAQMRQKFEAELSD